MVINTLTWPNTLQNWKLAISLPIANCKLSRRSDRRQPEVSLRARVRGAGLRRPSRPRRRGTRARVAGRGGIVRPMGGLSAAESGSLGSGEVSVAAAADRKALLRPWRGGLGQDMRWGGRRDRGEMCPQSRPRPGRGKPAAARGIFGRLRGTQPRSGRDWSGFGRACGCGKGVSLAERDFHRSRSPEGLPTLSQKEAAVLVEKAFFLRAKRGDLLRPRQEAAPVTTTRWPALQWAERIFAATSQETCCRHGERKMPIVAATRGFLSRGHGGEASIVSRL